MPSRQNTPPAPTVLSTDRATLNALKDMPAYAPHDQAHNTAALVALESALAQAELEAARARRAYGAARAELNRAGWAFHDCLVNARLEVKAQFGPDSHEVRAAGMVPTSERRRHGRRARTTTS